MGFIIKVTIIYIDHLIPFPSLTGKDELKRHLMDLKRDKSPFFLLINMILEQTIGIQGNYFVYLFMYDIPKLKKILLVKRKGLLRGLIEYYGEVRRMNGVNNLDIKATWKLHSAIINL